jgi:hypothetical protein
VHAADEPRKSKEMVAMQMGDEDGGYGLQFLVIHPYLGLGVLTTVQQ